MAWYPGSRGTHKNTHDASLSAAIQMSWVAGAATSQCRRRRPRRIPTPQTSSVAAWTDPRRPSPPPPHFPPLPRTIRERSPQPSPPPPPSPTSTQGSLCQRLAPGQPVSSPAPQAAYGPLRTLHKLGDSSRLV